MRDDEESEGEADDEDDEIDEAAEEVGEEVVEHEADAAADERVAAHQEDELQVGEAGVQFKAVKHLMKSLAMSHLKWKYIVNTGSS